MNNLRLVLRPEVARNVAGEEEQPEVLDANSIRKKKQFFIFKIDMWQSLIGPRIEVSTLGCTRVCSQVSSKP